AGCCEPDQPSEILVPREMVTPRMLPRVVKGNALAAHRISRLSTGVLVTVTALAGVRKVRRSMAPTAGARDNVFDSKRVRRVSEGRKTILAPPGCSFYDEAALASARSTIRHAPARRALTA